MGVASLAIYTERRWQHRDGVSLPGTSTLLLARQVKHMRQSQARNFATRVDIEMAIWENMHCSRIGWVAQTTERATRTQ